MARIEELELVASLRVEMIEENQGARFESSLLEATRKWMHELTARGWMCSWLAEAEEGGTIGAVTVRIREASPRADDLIGREAYVHNLYVRPAFRRGGVGRRLMVALLEWCQANGYFRIALRATEIGRPLYESLGFVADSVMAYRAPKPSPPAQRAKSTRPKK